MSKKKLIPRRDLLKLSATWIATGLTAPVLSTEACLDPTPEQPLGPFFPVPDTPIDTIDEGLGQNHEDIPPALAIAMANDNNLVKVMDRQGEASGTKIWIEGTITDQNCQPVEDASVIIWQASETGLYNHRLDQDNHEFSHPEEGHPIRRTHDPSFQYWGKYTTGKNGRYNFLSILPGFYPANLASSWYRPPHIHFMVSTIGRDPYITQMYFNCPSLEDNEFFQRLNNKDHLFQQAGVNRSKLLVDFRPKNKHQKYWPQYKENLLSGSFDIQIA